MIAQAEPAQSPAADPGLAYGETPAQRARGLFEEGRRAFDEGRFSQALERFEEAYALSGRPELLYNVGLAADRLRDDARALEAFEGYLAATEATTEDSAQAADQRAQVESRVAALRVARDRRLEEEKRSTRMAASSGAPQEPRADRPGVHTRWWFWTGIVLVVAGGVTAAVLLTRSDQPADLPDPNTGVVVPTLRWSGP